MGTGEWQHAFSSALQENPEMTRPQTTAKGRVPMGTGPLPPRDLFNAQGGSKDMPSGQEIVIHLLSTWGDPHYMGLTAVEVMLLSAYLTECLSAPLFAPIGDQNSDPNCDPHLNPDCDRI